MILCRVFFGDELYLIHICKYYTTTYLNLHDIIIFRGKITMAKEIMGTGVEETSATLGSGLLIFFLFFMYLASENFSK